MELKDQLKAHRTRLGLSQEELAERIYVSRQTISNWEIDRTYPDVQSLLLLSAIFDTSIDELVKGDLGTMEKKMTEDHKKIQRLIVAGLAACGAGLVCLAVGIIAPSAPSSLIPIFTEGELLGVSLFLALWIIGMVPVFMVERITQPHALVTYQDILAFSRGEEPTRNASDFSRRHRVLSTLLKIVAGAAVGAVIAFVLTHIA